MLDLPDLTDTDAVTDDELREAADKIAKERDRRYVRASAIAQGCSLARQYRDAGGNVVAALNEIETIVLADPPAEGEIPA